MQFKWPANHAQCDFSLYHTTRLLPCHYRTNRFLPFYYRTKNLSSRR